MTRVRTGQDNPVPSRELGPLCPECQARKRQGAIPTTLRIVLDVASPISRHAPHPLRYLHLLLHVPTGPSDSADRTRGPASVPPSPPPTYRTSYNLYLHHNATDLVRSVAELVLDPRPRRASPHILHRDTSNTEAVLALLLKRDPLRIVRHIT